MLAGFKSSAGLTREDQTPTLRHLLQTQGFSNQCRGSCRCARACSKNPHPIPDGAKCTSPAYSVFTDITGSKSLPATIREQHKPILHQEPHPHERSFPSSSSLLAFSKLCSYRGQNRKLQGLSELRDQLRSTAQTRYQWSAPLPVPEEKLGSFIRSITPPQYHRI